MNQTKDDLENKFSKILSDIVKVVLAHTNHHQNQDMFGENSKELT